MGESLTRTEIRMEKTKENIINSALEVFDEYGYIKAKVSDITEKANVGYGTFYQYFKNKQGLLIFLIEEMSNHIGDYIYLKNHKGLDIKERLYYGVLDILNFYIKYKTIFLIIKEAEANDIKFANSERKIQENLFKRIDHDIKYFIKKGYCRDGVGDEMIVAISCMIDGYARQMLKIPEEKIYTVTIAKTLTEVSYNILFKE